MKKTIFTTIAIGVLGVLACSNKKDSEPAPKSKTELLTAHPWKFVSSIYEGKEYIRDCEKDDIVNFYTDSTMIYEINEKCGIYNSGDTNTWYFNKEETEISLYEDTAHVNLLRVKILDDNNLEFYDKENSYLKFIK